MGLLQTVQLINRYLPELPTYAPKVYQLTIPITDVHAHDDIPDWFHEFTKFEYLHIDGKYTASLLAIPEGIFDSMTSLTAIHFGCHPAVTQFPSLRGASNLKSLTLAAFLSLKSLPSFDNLHQLERLIFSVIPQIDRIPDLAPLINLQSFITVDWGTWCCNGYLGNCDLKNPLCMVHPIWRTPAATCLAKEVASNATLKTVTKFSSSICGPVLHRVDLKPPLIIPEDVVTQRNGTLYRRCKLPGVKEAMCFNLRLTVISCVQNTFAIEMRRRQVQEGVGDPCNPEDEAWLGCK